MHRCESPRHPFEIFTTHFPVPPHTIIDDNACKLHAYSLNRKPTLYRGGDATVGAGVGVGASGGVFHANRRSPSPSSLPITNPGKSSLAPPTASRMAEEEAVGGAREDLPGLVMGNNEPLMGSHGCLQGW